MFIHFDNKYQIIIFRQIIPTNISLTRRADFVIVNKLTVELKALINLEDVHLAQVKNYVVAYNFDKGLLINFGAKSLQYNLIFNPKLNSVNSDSDSFT